MTTGRLARGGSAMRRATRLAAVAIMAAVLSASPAPAQEEIEVDLELILAVDISLSMDEEEQRLQRDGYVAAIRHPEVVEAIGSGMTGRIALTYLEWAGIAS